MSWDAIVVGSGPNGLAAAITLARAGQSVLVREAQPTLGGGARSGELTLPGFTNDLCSSIHPFAAGSPFLRTLPLEEHGLVWVHGDVPLAHPLPGGDAAVLYRSLDETAAGLGEDGAAWKRLHQPFVDAHERFFEAALRPMVGVPGAPFLLARFGLQAQRPAAALARSWFRTERARALFGGIAAHSLIPLEWRMSAAFGLMLVIAGHTVGWPFPRGGSQKIADAMASYLRSLGGEIQLGMPVESLAELDAKRILLDVPPRTFLRLAGDRLPAGYRAQLQAFKHGPGAYKLDYALSAPVPWANPAVRRAGTIHLGASLDELCESELAPWEGRVPERPYVLSAQTSVFDPTRAPDGKHTFWAYGHVPNGWEGDATEALEAQIERYAPGFRDVVLHRTVTKPLALEARNANVVGGDLAGGANTFDQIVFRPVRSIVPYATPLPGVWLCSASTPPGGGVHGMCGFLAASAALAAG
jgi:phytoene dehydrogenase-like protein